MKDVNDKGGIFVKEYGKKIPVEVVAKYDDTGSAETLLRLEEKLMTQDKVDFVLAPYSRRSIWRRRRSSPNTAIRSSR